MARPRKEDPPKGSPAWMSTFSDLMNLLLCFFVMLFAMSTIDAEKYEQVVASLQSAFSIMPNGGSAVGQGQLVSSGVSQLDLLTEYYDEDGDYDTEADSDISGELDEGANADLTEVDAEEADTDEIVEAYQEQTLAESEQMAEEIEEALKTYGIQDDVEVSFNGQYVCMNLNGALLFDSGKSELKDDAAYALIDKIGQILESYDSNIIEIEGHTDNVPISSSKYEDNNVLSCYRALTVAEYLREITDIDASHFTSSGRGEYSPVADNSTAEGRARNRRVEIKVYNSYYSDLE